METNHPLAALADELAGLYNRGNKLTACRQVAAHENRGELSELVKERVSEAEQPTFTKLYSSIVK